MHVFVALFFVAAHPDGDTWNEPGDGRWPRGPSIGEDLATTGEDVSLVVGTVVPPPSSNDALLAPLPAVNPAPTLAATTMSLND